MKISMLLAIGSFFLLTASCAHKQIDSNKEDAKLLQDKQAKLEESMKAAATAEEAVTCVVNKDKRLITMDKKTKRCEVFYTKFGEKSQVAWAEATPSICTDVLGKIRKNIEDKGFKCTSGLLKEEIKKDEPTKTAKEESSRDTASAKK